MGSFLAPKKMIIAVFKQWSHCVGNNTFAWANLCKTSLKICSHDTPLVCICGNEAIYIMIELAFSWWTGLGREPASHHTYQTGLWMSEVLSPYRSEKSKVLTLSLQSKAYWNMWHCWLFQSDEFPMARGRYTSIHLHMYTNRKWYYRDIWYMYIQYISVHSCNFIFTVPHKEILSSGMDWLAVSGRTRLAFFQVPWPWSKFDTWDFHEFVWLIHVS